MIIMKNSFNKMKPKTEQDLYKTVLVRPQSVKSTKFKESEPNLVPESSVDNKIHLDQPLLKTPTQKITNIIGDGKIIP